MFIIISVVTVVVVSMVVIVTVIIVSVVVIVAVLVVVIVSSFRGGHLVRHLNCEGQWYLLFVGRVLKGKVVGGGTTFEERQALVAVGRPATECEIEAFLFFLFSGAQDTEAHKEKYYQGVNCERPVECDQSMYHPIQTAVPSSCTPHWCPPKP
jgi:hypothetical protein